MNIGIKLSVACILRVAMYCMLGASWSVSAQVSGYAESRPQAADVVSELSRRSHIPEAELNELLRDCNQHQLSMNICAARDFTAADLEFQNVLANKLATLPNQCHSTLKKNQKKWAATRDRKCTKEADAEAEGGSMRPMIYSVCRTEATSARVALLMKVSACKRIQ